jgi:hypothetical protein
MKLYSDPFITKFKGDVPRCASAKQYGTWKLAAYQYPPASKVGFCEDCTPEYQAEMIEQARCENPHVWFCKDKDGLEYGTVGNKTTPQTTKKPKGGKNV